MGDGGPGLGKVLNQTCDPYGVAIADQRPEQCDPQDCPQLTDAVEQRRPSTAAFFRDGAHTRFDATRLTDAKAEAGNQQAPEHRCVSAGGGAHRAQPQTCRHQHQRPRQDELTDRSEPRQPAGNDRAGHSRQRYRHEHHASRGRIIAKHSLKIAGRGEQDPIKHAADEHEHEHRKPETASREQSKISELALGPVLNQYEDRQEDTSRDKQPPRGRRRPGAFGIDQSPGEQGESAG